MIWLKFNSFRETPNCIIVVALTLVDNTHINGLFINAGWCYGGFKAIPASGWCFAHLLAKGYSHSLSENFRLDRFKNGYMIDEKGQGAQPNLH